MNPAVVPRSAPPATPDVATIAPAVLWGGRLLVAWALLTPLTIPLPGPGGIRLAISDLLGMATVAVVPFVAIGRGRMHRLAPLLLVLGWALMSTLYNLDAFPSAIQGMFRVVRAAFILSPLALALLIGDDLSDAMRDAVIDAYLAATLGGVMIGLIAHQVGYSVVQAQTYDFGRGLVARATGLMGDSSAFGHLGASGVALVLCLLAIERRPGRLRLLLCAALLAVLPAFFYQSLSRALLIDLVVVVLAMVALAMAGALDRARVLGRIVGALLAAGVLIGGLAAAFPFEARTVVTRLDLDSLVEYGGDPAALIDRMGSGRGSVWSDTIALAQANPGLGLGYKGLITRYFIPGDNVFLTAFADLGVIGGLMVLALVGLVTALVLAAAFGPGRGSVVAAVAAPLWIGQVAHMLLVDVTSYYSSFPIVLVIVALAITVPRPREAQRASDWRWMPGTDPADY